MSLVVQPEGNGRIGDSANQRDSAWQELDLRVSKAEYEMILHLRMLGAGVSAVRLLKTRRGMHGLQEFRVCEVVRPVERSE